MRLFNILYTIKGIKDTSILIIMQIPDELKRVNMTVKIDPRVADMIRQKATEQGIPVSRWVERYFFEDFKRLGIFPASYERLGELRGKKGSKDT